MCGYLSTNLKNYSVGIPINPSFFNLALSLVEMGLKPSLCKKLSILEASVWLLVNRLTDILLFMVGDLDFFGIKFNVPRGTF